MDGVFMRNLLKKWLSLFLAVVGIWLCLRMADRQQLQNNVIRLHVVGESDSEEDQNLKLQVRDAILEELSALEELTEISDAKEAVEEMLPKLQEAANRVLSQAGSSAKAAVSFLMEEFPVRDYETFRLPSGVYHSLRVTVGEGEGKNWWCVVFPKLCLGAVSRDVRSTAAGAGFSDSLGNAITGEEGYELDFFILDVLGKLENFFRMG